MPLTKAKSLLLSTALCALAACGGGGGNGGGGNAGGGNPPPASSPPVAAFTATPPSGTAPLGVTVDASSSTAGSTAITGYRWSFGNGSTAEGPTATTRYDAAGSYTITLTVTASDGLTASATRSVAVGNPTVPNLAGMNEAQAQAALESAGLVVGTIETWGTGAGGTSQVIAQTRAAGSTVEPGTVVGFEATTDPGGARGPIDLFFRTPSAPRAFLRDDAPILVQVTSTYELTSGVASMAGRAANLTYRPGSQFPSPCYLEANCYSGTLPLAGVPVGPDRLRVRVTDTRGNYNEISTPVVHDDPPRLTIRTPADNAVAVPTLAVDVSCSDDSPGCRVETLGPAGNASRPHLADGTGGVTATVDLSQYIGGAIDLVFRAFDSAGQVTEVHRNIYVESAARLSIAEAPQGGDIVAAAGQRLLLLERLDAGDRVSIYDRGTRSREAVALADGWRVDERVAFLTPTGAIFPATPLNGNALGIRLFLWRSGTLTDLAHPDGGTSLDVAGRYAIWNQGSALYRLDTSGGTPQIVTGSSVNTDNVVAADGSVVFQFAGLVRDRAGTQTLLTPDNTVGHLRPRTDGSDVVYLQRQLASPFQTAVAFIAGGAAPVLLTAFRSGSPSYDIAGGWVSFTDLGANGQTHVWTRAPDGSLLRRTDFASSSEPERLAPNGDVMLRRGFTQRYLSRGTQLLEIGSANGKPYYLDGAWYVALGGTLLAVRDTP